MPLTAVFDTNIFFFRDGLAGLAQTRGSVSAFLVIPIWII